MIEKIVISNGTNTTFGALTWLRTNPVTTPTGHSASYVIANVAGLSTPKAEVNVTNYATYGGGFYNGSRLETRNITFDIYFPKTGAPGNSKLRSAITSYLSCGKPLNVEIYIDGTSSSSKYTTTAYLEECTGDVFGGNLELTTLHVSLICPDPYFYASPSRTTAPLTTGSMFYERTFSMSYTYKTSSANKLESYYSIEIPSTDINMNNDFFAEIIDVSAQKRILGVYLNIPGGIPPMSISFDPRKRLYTLPDGYVLPATTELCYGFFNGTQFERVSDTPPLSSPIVISSTENVKSYIVRTQCGLYSAEQPALTIAYNFDGRKELCVE